MSWAIGAILVISWLLGVLTGYTLGGIINILLVIGVIVLMARLTGTKNIVAIWTRKPIKKGDQCL